MSKHEDRMRELIAHEAASFILRESNGQSLITVTRAILAKHGDHATVFISVFPTEESRAAITFCERLAGDFRTHLATHARLHPLPVIHFQLDDGEANRQHLDELSKKIGGPSGIGHA